MMIMRKFASDQEGTQLLFPVIDGVIQHRPYMIKDLQNIRKSLHITLQEAANYLGVSKALIGHYETGRRAVTDDFMDRYYTYLQGCKEGRISYTQSIYKLGPGRKKWYRPDFIVDSKDVQTLCRIRQLLGISQKDASRVVQISQQNLSKKEYGIRPMLKSEYEALMKYYRAEKLKRIFGKNYKGE